MMRVQAATIVAAVLVTTAAARAATPPSGVYSCYDARMAFSPSGSHLVIEPTPVAMFGLIDGTTYSDFDGHHGQYVFDAAAGVITMTDGPRQGWRYKKIGDWSFTLIDNRDGTTHYTCPLEATKNPQHGPW